MADNLKVLSRVFVNIISPAVCSKNINFLELVTPRLKELMKLHSKTFFQTSLPPHILYYMITL